MEARSRIPTFEGRRGGQREDLRKICADVLQGRPLVIASNRGPMEYRLLKDGSLQAQRGQGGVVTALSSVGLFAKTIWVASAMGEGDKLASTLCGGGHFQSTVSARNLRVRFVNSPKAVYERFYNVFSNPLLWFLQHRMSHLTKLQEDPEALLAAWQKGYVVVNQAFAEAVVAEAEQAGPMPLVMLHDYHLYLVAEGIRSKLPQSAIQHFVHIPWPPPIYWQVLPASMVTAICRSLCNCDIVGFQIERDARNFLLTVEQYLPGARIDYMSRSIAVNGHTTLARHYPISVDATELQRKASSATIGAYVKKLQSRCGKHTILRVDRLEPTKNILDGFRAFELLLRQHPELVSQVKFLAFLVPSRENIPEYQHYADEVWAIVDRINATFGQPGCGPIDVYYENNYEQALAAMQLYDVLLVNPSADGMNLVAKEGPLVNRRDGVLVLSEGAGAFEQLHLGTIGVTPDDVEGTARALYDGLIMPVSERREKAQYLRRIVSKGDVGDWFRRQFEDLRQVSPPMATAIGLPTDSSLRGPSSLPIYSDESFAGSILEV